MTTKVKHSNPTDGSHMSDFLVNLEQHQRALLLIRCLPLPFDSATIMTITRFVDDHSFYDFDNRFMV